MPKKTQQAAVAVRKTGHEAGFRKVRCPNCKTDCAVGDGKGGFVCSRCHTTLRAKTL